MKGLKTILNNDDVLVRFRLLQLWMIDTFTKTLKDNEPNLSKLISETMINDNIDDSPEHMLNTLIELKKDYEEYNKKLLKVSALVNLQNKYAKVLKSIDENIELGKNDVEEIIEKNNKLINGINELNINSFKDDCDSMKRSE